ncbi:hypothetical protein JDW21_18695 [Bacillus subtilis]|uniref:Uncharacterized protein n=2 Tax=Zhangjivirus TaxID=3044867 RepID=A0AAE9GC73_9CAUD|nr:MULTISPECIES: hypothetical protein [Bacillus subtilis group]YP_010681637.1 metallo-endopeptidase [Bacillus phage vB_BsuS_PJN02]YP_010740147.1 hypothetical protein P9294_gp130 [Bacillus phage FADO]MCR4362164.1 hypothetical protein [Bacillus subtilis]UNH58362.1 endopeptidase [Bacillus phage vB_BsuS_PJN02]UNY48845.1 hypothetical protein fado_130 [Bacillus phage FADO]UQB84236.1 hypothetical protein KMZ31_20195 [Bacillus amyloliquefaciens]WOF32859.1 hypothetical protein OEJ84_23450 [Bacillus s
MIVKINGERFLEASSEPATNTGGFWSDIQSFWDFLREWREVGFWEAMYGKSFFEVAKDFLLDLLHELGLFILGNSDLFFLCPAVVLMFGTFIVGRNKYAKFIIPLWFAYFLSRVFYKMII